MIAGALCDFTRENVYYLGNKLYITFLGPNYQLDFDLNTYHAYPVPAEYQGCPLT
jgi:hypothetical protein